MSEIDAGFGGTMNQLDRVICQIKFHPILSINAKIGLFQDEIKSEYPISVIQQSVQIVNMDVHDFTFSTEDNKWVVSVSMNALSLTTTSYTSWSEFVNRFSSLISSFTKCFDLDRIVRIGLRYVNAIRPSKVGMGQSIDSLIVQKYRSFIQSDIGEVLNSNTVLELKIDEEAICRSSFGLIHFLDDNESGFLIDNDVISTIPSIPMHDLQRMINKFNTISDKMFLNMTTDVMHKAVGCQ